MGDKNLMENILLLEKGVCDLFLHGTIESSTSSVHQAFSTALHDSLGMQDTIYDMMAEKGWYPAEQAEQKKIDSVRQKFSRPTESLFLPSQTVSKRSAISSFSPVLSSLVLS